MKNTDNFLISNKTKSNYFGLKNKPPGLFFVRIKNEILGKNYELSLVFIGSAKSRKLNKEYRKKDKPTNILAFPLSKTEGEIFIAPEVAKRNAKNFDMKENDFIVYLFIHGLLHLKNFKHGDKMEKEEEKLKKKYI